VPQTKRSCHRDPRSREVIENERLRAEAERLRAEAERLRAMRRRVARHLYDEHKWSMARIGGVLGVTKMQISYDLRAKVAEAR